MEDLLENGLYACETVRATRKGFPRQLKKPTIVRNRGEFKVLPKGDTNLSASVWMDKKKVHHLSTLSDPEDRMMIQRRVGSSSVTLPIPHSAHAYKFMGVVDLNDQHRACYDVGWKERRPWRYMFWYMLNVVIVNAFIMYKAASTRLTKKKTFTHLDFRLELLQELVAGYGKRKRSAVEQGHFDCKLCNQSTNPHVNIRMNGKGRRCKFHWAEMRIRKETVFGCENCKIPLCKDCHGRWHAKMESSARELLGLYSDSGVGVGTFLKSYM